MSRSIWATAYSVYFGYPQAHEHDAERAVRAGLELIGVVGGLKLPVPMQTQVGIATGLVVVGDLIGSGAAQEQGVRRRDTKRRSSLARHRRAEHGCYRRRAREDSWEISLSLRTSVPKTSRASYGSTRAWAALRVSSAAGRFEALHATGLTALVGREEELELLLRRWSRAKGGEGQVVFSPVRPVLASRGSLLRCWRLASEPHTRLRYFCSPQHTDSALYPVISQMERAAGFVHDDIPQTKPTNSTWCWRRPRPRMQDAALFAEMLSLPNDRRYPTIDLTAEQRRQRTLEALAAQVAELARQRPVLMIVEDAHWIDPTNLEAFGSDGGPN